MEQINRVSVFKKIRFLLIKLSNKSAGRIILIKQINLTKIRVILCTNNSTKIAIRYRIVLPPLAGMLKLDSRYLTNV